MKRTSSVQFIFQLHENPRVCLVNFKYKPPCLCLPSPTLNKPDQIPFLDMLYLLYIQSYHSVSGVKCPETDWDGSSHQFPLMYQHTKMHKNKKIPHKRNLKVRTIPSSRKPLWLPDEPDHKKEISVFHLLQD